VLMDERSLIYGVLRPEAIRVLLQSHRSGQQDNHKVLFSLVMFEQWLRATQTPRVASAGVY
jgi:asparagine synthase (glutamine-hydrolysing)